MRVSTRWRAARASETFAAICASSAMSASVMYSACFICALYNDANCVTTGIFTPSASPRRAQPARLARGLRLRGVGWLRGSFVVATNHDGIRPIRLNPHIVAPIRAVDGDTDCIQPSDISKDDDAKRDTAISARCFTKKHKAPHCNRKPHASGCNTLASDFLNCWLTHRATPFTNRTNRSHSDTRGRSNGASMMRRRRAAFVSEPVTMTAPHALQPR